MPLPKVLIFSREKVDGEKLSTILGVDLYDIVWTDNGPETIVQALAGNLDAVVIFVQKKGHRELEYIPCLNSIDDTLPVVVVSDQDSLKFQREIRRHRVFYYLPQPLEADEIRSVMEDAVASVSKRR
jgi:DNA-binding NtrC family response regulator